MRALTALLVTTALSVAAPAAATTYSDSQAAAHVGETATVEGLVTGTHISSKGTEFINFGGRYPNQDFTAVIFARNAAQIDVSQYYGKNLDVTGKIQLYQGKPEIIVGSPSQLVVVP
jgi:hypothetical protein